MGHSHLLSAFACDSRFGQLLAPTAVRTCCQLLTLVSQGITLSYVRCVASVMVFSHSNREVMQPPGSWSILNPTTESRVGEGWGKAGCRLASTLP